MPHESTGTSVSELRKTLVNLGLVFKVELGRAEDIAAQLENLLGSRIVYTKWSADKLYISTKPPWDAKEER